MGKNKNINFKTLNVNLELVEKFGELGWVNA